MTTFNNISLYRQYFRKYFLDSPSHSSSRTRRPSNCTQVSSIAISALFFRPSFLKNPPPSVGPSSQVSKMSFFPACLEFRSIKRIESRGTRKKDSWTEGTRCRISCSGTWTNLPLLSLPSSYSSRLQSRKSGAKPEEKLHVSRVCDAST